MSRKLLLPRGVLLMMRQQLGSTEADKFICSLALGVSEKRALWLMEDEYKHGSAQKSSPRDEVRRHKGTVAKYLPRYLCIPNCTTPVVFFPLSCKGVDPCM